MCHSHPQRVHAGVALASPQGGLHQREVAQPSSLPVAGAPDPHERGTSSITDSWIVANRRTNVGTPSWFFGSPHATPAATPAAEEQVQVLDTRAR